MLDTSKSVEERLDAFLRTQSNGLRKMSRSTVDAGKPKSLTHSYIASTWPWESAFVVGKLLANRSIGPVFGINAELCSVFDLFREEEDLVVVVEVHQRLVVLAMKQLLRDDGSRSGR